MNGLIVIDGFQVRRDVAGRYCLNDLHRVSGGEKRHQPSNWSSLAQTKELIDEISTAPEITGAPIATVAGGYNQGTYVCKELVYAYAMWISASFHLKVIRTFDALVSQQHQEKLSDKVQAGVILLESMSKSLNFSNSSKLGAYQKLQVMAGLPELAPVYAIDAPSGSMDGSSRPTVALSTLIKKHNLPISAPQAFKRLAELGIVERLSRPSTKTASKVKEFWSVTARGCQFGKNMTSPNNPRETQPHFFESKTDELIRMVMLNKQVSA
ncbi:DNA-binding protein [Proteus mirabilis]|uniref:KilA-N domain-containing protein n=1 Tax=Proteus mirabilis TaxID=584 RepID=UPI0008DD159B|nr:KilA-N domain-containing protein [Proteus mirabilis]EKX5073837.1 KilA-N domain-containing protein [Proteus mirabilis]ELB2727330.1 KilA-N domain-containing protein [Proteus mirabilis]ELN3979135.1 KilA-N domain-containing protein [Proteus mirabilis]EMA4641727.1 KilA-N domain-containing protein [Proteus mirabilis]EMD5948715.1 KilA-N domain-containing protein [Proteus mirabilis]